MSRPTRLLHVTTTDISLGLLLGPQLLAFAASGYEVLTASAAGPFADDLVAQGVAHYPLRHATRSIDFRRDVLALGELYRLIRQLQPDVVHTHNPKPGIYGRLAGRAARVRAVVNTVHGLYALPTDRLVRRATVYGLERMAAACSDAELVQNPEDLETLRRLRVPEDRLHLLGNGVDLDRFDPDRVLDDRREAIRQSLRVRSDEVLVGAVGRLVREKGYRELFACFRQVRGQNPTARLVVVGPSDDDKADALSEAELMEAKTDGVIFTGMRHDIEDLYRAMDIYVLASWREGFPRSAMEAAAMGLPAVLTDIRGCRQVVEDGVSGLLVPPRRPGPLGDAIGRLVADGDMRSTMGHQARKKALQEFDQSHVIDLTLAVYQRLAGGPRTANR